MLEAELRRGFAPWIRLASRIGPAIRGAAVRKRLQRSRSDSNGPLELLSRDRTGIAGGLVADAVIGGIASSAYGWGRYHYYGGPSYYSGGYYGGPYAYDYGTTSHRWGGRYTTTYYTATVSYGYRYRRVVRPSYAYYRGSYPVVRHHWHRPYRHW